MLIDISYYRDFFVNALREYDIFHNYYIGEQEYYFNRFLKQPKLDDLLRNIKSNMCKPVVDLISSRLSVVDILGVDNNSEISLTEDDSNLASIFDRVMLETLIYGDSYITVWGDSYFIHSPINTAVQYDGEGNVISGLSYRNRDDNKTDVFYYTPEFIYKGVAESFTISDKFEPIDIFENEYNRVPLVHFYNDNPLVFRRSELINVIPLQRVLNKTIQDRALASELAAFKQKWVTGLQYDIDPTTNEPISPFESDVAKILVSTNPDTKFGEFGETNLENYTKVIDSLHKEISMVSSIPLHLFNLSTGNFPSGEALKTAESPFVSKIEQKQRLFLKPIKEVLSLLYPTFDDFNIIFSNPSPESLSTKLDNALKKLELGVSREIVLKELGY